MPAQSGAIVGHAAEAFPAATLDDWVSWANHVSLFTVLAEQERPWGEHEQTYGEGMILRDVTVRVDRILWRDAASPKIPSDFTALTDGWALNNRERSPMGRMGGPRLEVGGHYLGAWTYSSHAGWEALSVTAVFPVDVYGRAQRHEWSESSRAALKFVGTTPGRVSLMLSMTAPDPRVSTYAHLEAWERWLALAFEQLPDRPGFLKATPEKAPGGQLGYVREEDWKWLQRELDPALVAPFYHEDGSQYSTDEGGGITFEGYVFEG